MTRGHYFLVFMSLFSSHAIAKDDFLCGRKANMVDIVIEMQRPSVQSVWRDHKLFINKDGSDGSVWAFSMPNTTVHPSAVCRRRVGMGETSKVEIGFLCSKSEKACNSFKLQALERMDKLENKEN